MGKSNDSRGDAPLANLALPYRPQNPREYSPGIGLVGCGGITRHHLQAYTTAGYKVAGFFDIARERAIERRDHFYPDAIVYDSLDALLADPTIEVVDITTHPPERPPLIEAALRAQKHVLSQKPFVLDLAVGERLAQLAEDQGVLLAVNQNGRWAPHLSYIRQVVEAGWIGQVASLHCAQHWDHSWTKDTPFEDVRHLILYDYAIHWFDFLTCIMGDRQPLRVYASVAHSPTQQVRPPLLGQALVEYADAQATLVFDACNPIQSHDTTFLVGTTGTVRAEGLDINHQQVMVTTDRGEWRPRLEGSWFDDGFHGAMGDLLCAIEQNRPPLADARQNLRSLALCFAAVHSADTHQPVVPGTVTVLPE